MYEMDNKSTKQGVYCNGKQWSSEWDLEAEYIDWDDIGLYPQVAIVAQEKGVLLKVLPV